MLVSNAEVKQSLASSPTPTQNQVDAAMIKVLDADLVREAVAMVNELPDRDDRVAEVKAAIAAGTYQRTGEEIAVAMAKRALADRVR